MTERTSVYMAHNFNKQRDRHLHLLHIRDDNNADRLPHRGSFPSTEIVPSPLATRNGDASTTIQPPTVSNETHLVPAMNGSLDDV